MKIFLMECFHFSSRNTTYDNACCASRAYGTEWMDLVYVYMYSMGGCVCVCVCKHAHEPKN